MKHYINSNNEIFAYELDGSQDHLIGDKTPISEEQASSLLQQKQQANLAMLNYADLRKLEYPPIGDQLDALYHAGVFPAEMAATIAAVKSKYPKT
jgi:ribosomal protein S6